MTPKETSDTTADKVALVFGISGDQGQSVASGLLATGSYRHVYGATREAAKDHANAIAGHMFVPVEAAEDEEIKDNNNNDADNIGSVAKKVTLIDADLNNASSLRQAFVSTRATDIFLVTTTEVPIEGESMGSFHESEELEYDTIKSFFDVLVDVHTKEWNSNSSSGGSTKKKLERHVVFSTLDNVRGLVEWLETHNVEGGDDLSNMKPLDDGGIVPHYSGKGRGGEYALSLIHGVSDPWKSPPSQSGLLELPWMNASASTPSIIPGLSATLITLPFLHTNFALSATPLPTNTEGRATQWSISACLGEASQPIDMFSVSDLKYIVPILFQHHQNYEGQTIKLSGEKISMEEVAYQFSDLFGKDVIYSPLTLEEMNSLDIPEAPAFAQMCQYLSSPYADHNLEATKAIMSLCGREPQTFQDWLLSHSDEEAFEKVGLTLDASPIQCVAVFNATSVQGESIIKGLLSDTRKQYTIRACICHGDENQGNSTRQRSHGQLEVKANEIQSLDTEHITIQHLDLDDAHSCIGALEGADGAFMVTDFYHPYPHLPPQDPEREDQEERRARIVIDACAASGVKHLVFSMMEPADDVDNELRDGGDDDDAKPMFDAKARVAAYAKAKHISITYVLLPVYSEQFFKELAEKIRDSKEKSDGGKTVSFGDEKENIADKNTEGKVVCMSSDELGTAVANIFDSYEVYSGHEIGLVTDMLSLAEATEIVQQIFFESPASISIGSTQHSDAKSSADSHSEYRLDIVAKDLGSLFRYYSKTDAVKKRASIAKTLELVPDAKPFKSWLAENRDNVEFREMLGIR